MDKNRNLIFLQPEYLRDFGVINFFHVPHFQKMIPRAERAELRPASFQGPVADQGRVRTVHAPSVFRPLQVFGPAIPVLNGPGRTLL